jgi:2-oxoglutarate dehydrogenase E2 component (dihydrolipoamide succinyltransferase)
MIKTVQAPRINTNDNQVGVVVWHVEDGDFVEIGQAIVDLETSKAVVTVDAAHTGYVRRLAKQGEILRVGANLMLVADSHTDFLGEMTLAPMSPASDGTEKSSAIEFSTVRFSAAALRLIQSSGLKQSDFTAAGLVTQSMVANRINPSAKSMKRRTRASQVAPRVKTPQIRTGPIVPREEGVSLGKRAEIEQLLSGESGQINSTLSVYFDSADVRARLKAMGSFDGSISPIILYELSRLLLQWPQFTAYYENELIHFYDRIDLGIAVDLGKGLKVVRIKDADLLTPQQIFEQTIDFGMRYLENRIKPDELVGSTITVTDLSGLDVLHFRPLINGKQSAILGIGGDSFMPGFPMSINMAFDHRVSNGREAALFLKELRARVLSYAPSDGAGSNPGVSQSSDNERTAPGGLSVPTPVSCNKCGIDIESYNRDFGNSARMLAGVEPDGSLVAVCHRCWLGYI